MSQIRAEFHQVYMQQQQVHCVSHSVQLMYTTSKSKVGFYRPGKSSYYCVKNLKYFVTSLLMNVHSFIKKTSPFLPNFIVKLEYQIPPFRSIFMRISAKIANIK